MSLVPAKSTVVFDSYWYLAAERQNIFFQRLSGAPPPWTSDPILLAYKFTNAYRASDRVSQYLISRVIYEGDQDPREVFFRTILFKIFNKIETWELLQKHLDFVSYDSYSFERYDRVLSQAMDVGQSIYSAAYIMPSGGARSNVGRKHRVHLRLIEKMMAERLPERVAEARTMARVFELLRSYPTVGDFLAYQYATDLNYSTLTDFDETSFVVPGPGARDGIRKCFSDLGGYSESDIIKRVTFAQHDEFRRLGICFPSLWERDLQFIDCQNLFCEVDKYARVKHPEILGRTRRTRIKQKFHPSSSPLPLFYPPKWNINEKIPSKMRY